MKRVLKWFFISIVLLLVLLFWFGYQPDIPPQVLKEKYGQPPSQFISVNGLAVHFRSEGQGVPLVLLHGTGASLHTWDGWVDELKDSFKVVRMDLPAFGLTGPGLNGEYSIEAYADFVHQFTRLLKLDSFHLAGNSLGGQIAWNYAHAHPEQVQKLILLDAAGAPSDRPKPAVFKLAQQPVTAFLLRHILPRSFIEKNMREVYFDHQKISPALVDRYYEMALREGNRQAFIDRANMVFADMSAKLKNILCPTLIVWGANDGWVPVEDAHYFKKVMPNATLKIYQETGHVPMEERPVETAKDAMAFLKNE